MYEMPLLITDIGKVLIYEKGRKGSEGNYEHRY